MLDLGCDGLACLAVSVRLAHSREPLTVSPENGTATHRRRRISRSFQASLSVRGAILLRARVLPGFETVVAPQSPAPTSLPSAPTEHNRIIVHNRCRSVARPPRGRIVSVSPEPDQTPGSCSCPSRAWLATDNTAEAQKRCIATFLCAWKISAAVGAMRRMIFVKTGLCLRISRRCFFASSIDWVSARTTNAHIQHLVYDYRLRHHSFELIYRFLCHNAKQEACMAEDEAFHSRSTIHRSTHMTSSVAAVLLLRSQALLKPGRLRISCPSCSIERHGGFAIGTSSIRTTAARVCTIHVDEQTRHLPWKMTFAFIILVCAENPSSCFVQDANSAVSAGSQSVRV